MMGFVLLSALILGTVVTIRHGDKEAEKAEEKYLNSSPTRRRKQKRRNKPRSYRVNLYGEIFDRK